MTGDKNMLTNIIYSDGGSVTFGDNSKGYIIGKGDVSNNAMAQIMKQLKTLYNFFVPVERRSVSRNEDMRSAEANDEEDFTYTTTRCLSSYYSIFVARLAIMIMLAILIGMLTILTWHFTRVYTTNSINSLAYGLRYELLQRPVLRMWNILNSTVEVTMAQVKLSEYVIDRYDNPVTQEEQMKLYQMMKDITWAVFASRKALDAITISYTNGFVQAFHRNHRSNATFYIYSDLVFTSYQNLTQQSGIDIQTNVSAIWYGEPLDPDTGDKTGDRRRIPPDELINIAGLPEVRDGAASWRIAVSKFSDSPLLSAALPVRHPSNGSIVAVVGVTTALKSVSQLMKELVGIHSGCMYLTTREGHVLATSTDAPLLRNTSIGLKLVMANESDNRIIKSGAEWLQKAYGDKFPISHEVHDDNVMLERKNYYIDSFFLNLRRLPLVGVIIIPRKSIMGKVDEIAFTTLIILISLSMCILAIGCICIFILTSGVSKAMKLRAELISHLDARRRAEASSNYKSQFLANMSHELRTPMAAVIGLLDILTYDGCLTNEQLATVTQIRKCSTALLRLLNNILDLSKVESGKLVLEEVEFDLGRELEGLADMFSVQCINHNVEIILDLSDDFPRKVKGDSARVVQIFTNLISNSIKFTLEGHVILRGWLQGMDESKSNERHKRRSRQDESDEDRDCNKDHKITLWFEVEDTGCGIDPSKWESVFESFEQADPSTTRKHGGTGLGLCIVRNLINKLGGEIKVAKKEGPGTLMQLYMVFGMPDGGIEKHIQAEFQEHSLAVLLALKGSKGSYIISQWLKMKGVITWEASEWNKLTQILQQLFKESSKISENGHSTGLDLNQDQNIKTKSSILIVVDTSLLDQSTNIWNEQLIFLDRYRRKTKFAWMLSHNTSNAIKLELQQRGHFLTVNKPLYKTKMIQMLGSLLSDEFSENSPMFEDVHECNEIDPIHFKDISSAESSDNENIDAIKNEAEESIPKHSNGIKKYKTGQNEDKHFELGTRDKICRTLYNYRIDAEGIEASRKVTTNRGALDGVYILLAEDNPILQRVATKMLEKMGATVVAVGDGVQAVDALQCMFKEEARRKSNIWQQENGVVTMKQSQQPEAFHLILMDCQMPKLDGYEATKAIRRLEAGTGSHIPIIAVTAHAMSSDEAKCLEVGMDAYMTKPLDYNLMVSTILAFTRSNG